MFEIKIMNCINAMRWRTDQEPTETSQQPIRTRYLGHVTGYQPIRDQYVFPDSVGSWRTNLVILFSKQKEHIF